MQENEVKPLRKIALVTGASSGIGQAVAIRLAKDGFHVLIHYHKNQKGAEQTFSEIHSIKGTAEVVQFDVKDRMAMENAIEKIFCSREGLTPFALVNNAGLHRDNLAGLMSDEEFDEVLKTNTSGPFYLIRHVLRKILRLRAGTIVNISSLSGQTGNPGQINYAASKAALIAMTKTLAMEVGARGIRVNAVAPGLIETEMIKGIPQIEEYKKRIPLNRFGTPNEVAAAVSFLCSEEASYITGQTLSVNGGLFPA